VPRAQSPEAIRYNRPVRPSKLWKELSPEVRFAAAEAFWQPDDSPDVQAPQLEATAALAKRLNFRLKSVRGLPAERRARLLAQMPDVPDAVAGRALIALHFASRRPLMGAFLDALGVPHDDGLITAENLSPPDAARLAGAVDAIRSAFPGEDVALYLRTLIAVDEDTWGNLEGLLQARP
jgi:hypothetical protein